MTWVFRRKHARKWIFLCRKILMLFNGWVDCFIHVYSSFRIFFWDFKMISSNIWTDTLCWCFFGILHYLWKDHHQRIPFSYHNIYYLKRTMLIIYFRLELRPLNSAHLCIFQYKHIWLIFVGRIKSKYNVKTNNGNAQTISNLLSESKRCGAM